MTERRVVLLDRDGTINRQVEGGYVTSWDGFEFLPGALEALAALTTAGFELAVVTNQAAVGKGLMDLAQLDAVHARMIAAIGRAGGRLARVYVCPHVPADACECRKPRPGLLLRAEAELQFDLAAAVMVGNSPADVEAGRRAGCRTILLKPDGESVDPADAWPPDHVAADLQAAARLIVSLVPAPRAAGGPAA